MPVETRSFVNWREKELSGIPEAVQQQVLETLPFFPTAARFAFTRDLTLHYPRTPNSTLEVKWNQKSERFTYNYSVEGEKPAAMRSLSAEKWSLPQPWQVILQADSVNDFIVLKRSALSDLFASEYQWQGCNLVLEKQGRGRFGEAADLHFFPQQRTLRLTIGASIPRDSVQGYEGWFDSLAATQPV